MRPAQHGDRLHWFMCLPATARGEIVESVLAAAVHNIELVKRGMRLRKPLSRVPNAKWSSLHDIGIALPVKSDVQSILALILRKAREIKKPAPVGYYVVEENTCEGRKNGQTERTATPLQIGQNDSASFPRAKSHSPSQKNPLRDL